MKIKYVIGIDEAGRGPLAGPMAVGAVAMSIGRQVSLRRLGIKDSKKLSPLRREYWYRWLKTKQKENKIIFALALISPQTIDRRGIGPAAQLGIKRCLKKLALKPAACRVLLDGGLAPPAEFRNQKTIIKGDELEPIIALASIVAKVRRDRQMTRLAKKFPAYDFEIHKGYGTANHYRKIKKHGLVPSHRRSFLRPLGK